MELQPGTRIDRYVVESLLGRGGMASVWKVRHDSLGSFFALKLLELPRRTVRERLEEEGRIQARLKHPNLVSVVDTVSVDGCPGLVMEYVNGPSLDAHLVRHRLTLEQVDALATDLLRGLKAAHAAGLVHRDLKPGNVLLARAPDGSVTAKIADFGLAKLVQSDAAGDQAMTRTGQVMGTPLYMAPEQFRNAKDVDARADIYSLGVMLYEVATGRRPYAGDDLFEIYERVQRADWPRPRELVPDLPERIERAILGAMAVERDRRTPDCDELLATWRGTREEDPWSPQPLALPAVAPPPSAAGATYAPDDLEASPSPTYTEPETVFPPTPPPPSRSRVPPVRRLRMGGAGLADRLLLGFGMLFAAGGVLWVGSLVLLPGAGTVSVSGDRAEVRVLTDAGAVGPGEVPAGSWPYEVRFSGGPWVRGSEPVAVQRGMPSVLVCDRKQVSCKQRQRASFFGGPGAWAGQQFREVTKALEEAQP